MNLDHVHIAEHSAVTFISDAVLIPIEKKMLEVRMVLLHQLFALAVPQSQALDLNLWIERDSWCAPILRMRLWNERKSVVVIGVSLGYWSTQCRGMSPCDLPHPKSGDVGRR